MKRKKIFNILFVACVLYLSSTALFGVEKTNKIEKRPLIGVSGSMLASKSYLNYYFSYVSNYYIRGIADSGGVPVIIPIVSDTSLVGDQIKDLDGLIMSGGADINPLKYGEQPSRYIGKIHPERDEFDFALLKAALKRKIPILGICRGNQLLNVFHGGTLHQDVEVDFDNAVEHRQSGNHEYGTHSVFVKKDSWLYSILKKDSIVVNSLHHQAVKDLAPGFKITAEAPDGVVEGIEKTKGSFCVGVQWHPEMMQGRNAEMSKLCRAFVNVCIENMGKSQRPRTLLKKKRS